jgi:hypothetical protein
MRRVLLISSVMLVACTAPNSNGHGGSGGSGSAGAGGTGGSGGDPGNGGSSGSGGSTGDDDMGKACGGMDFALNAVPPNVMLVLDRSQSMTDPISANPADAGTHKWDDLNAAVTTLVDGYDNQLRLGMDLFAPVGGKSCAAGKPGAIGDVGTGQTLLTALGKASPGSNTPTGATMQALVGNSLLMDAARDNYAIIITDGQPNCVSGEVDVVTNAIKALYSQTPSVKTFVIGLGADQFITPGALNDWADAGHTAGTGTVRYIPAGSQAALKTALQGIAQGVVTCTFTMQQAAPDPTLITVLEGGQPVSPSPTNGYVYDSNANTITLVGAPCDALKKTPTPPVKVIYGCPGPGPIT